MNHTCVGGVGLFTELDGGACFTLGDVVLNTQYKVLVFLSSRAHLQVLGDEYVDSQEREQ